VKKLCPFRLEDSWVSSRKNGSELVVTGRKDGLRNTLYMINRDGGILRTLTSDTSRYYTDPSFSPDGKQIVYRYREQKRNRSQLDELWIMNDDGTKPRQLTTYPRTIQPRVEVIIAPGRGVGTQRQFHFIQQYAERELQYLRY